MKTLDLKKAKVIVRKAQSSGPVKILNEDDLAEKILLPIAEKHGIVEACLEDANIFEIMEIANEPSPAKRLEKLLDRGLQRCDDGDEYDRD